MVELVVKRALDELVGSTHLAECKYPIGIDSRVEDLLFLLSNGSNDAQFVGICGIGGIGKTTIAKVVYNRIHSTFNRHSFLSDVKEQAKQCMGLVSLQKRLLKDIFKMDFDIGHYHRGKTLIKQRLCEENVLLVLDDVDGKDQIDALAGGLNWFGQGSRVIITTRDKHILNVVKIGEDKIYSPQKLGNDESLQLFSLHAFSMEEPPQDYMQLSHDVVRYSGGLPSFLEMLGSYLSDISSREEWKSTLRKLKTGKVSVSSLASLRRERKNICPIKDNSLGWCPPLHGIIGIGNTVAIASKILGGCLDPNGFTTTDRVSNKQLTTAEIQGTISKFARGNLNPNGSTATDGVGKRFEIAEIQAATRNFEESLVIGAGGFGKVYKGEINGTLAAIKRARPKYGQGQREFEREIEMLSKLRHRHVVSMIGFCEEKNEMILVYEYMANGNLRNHLYGSDLPPLTWKQRLHICIGAARGLHYLHTGSERGIIHRDVKTSNILLDEKFEAKMADFGLSKIGPEIYDTYVSTHVMGTLGYLDPEYMQSGQLTLKSDVYSFGVVLFEVVCGRPVFDRSLPSDRIHLTRWALQWQRNRSLHTIVDQRLEGKYSPKSLKIFGELAEKCVASKEGKNRPTMEEVLRHLEHALELHEAWLDNNGREDSTSSLPDGTVEYSDSRIVIELPLNDSASGEEYSSCSLMVGTVGCDEFSDLVYPQGR